MRMPPVQCTFKLFLVLLSGLLIGDLVRADDFERDQFADAGFESIFDGKTLKGWHISGKSGHSGASQHKSGGRWVV